MTKMKAMLVSCALLTAGAVFAADVVVDDKSVGTATYTLVNDGTDMTLTVDKLTTSGAVAVDDLTVTGDVSIVGSTTINSGSTISGQATSGTSKYNLSIVPVGSVDAFGGSVDGVHIGNEANAKNTTNAFVGAYISAGRPAGANATAAFPAGSPDTGLRVVSVNRATNNATAYEIEGAYVKAKNYTGGVVLGVTGLRVEAVNDGTDTAGKSSVVNLSTDSSTLDYGIDMDDVATPALGEIKFSNGTMLRVNTTNLIMVSADGATTNTFVQVGL